MTPEDLAQIARRLEQEALLHVHGFEPIPENGGELWISCLPGGEPELWTRAQALEEVTAAAAAVVHLPTFSTRPISKVYKERRAVEATDQLDRLIASRTASRHTANEEAAAQARADRERLARIREEHRVLWIEHFRRLAACNLASARDYRSRARALERGETA